MWKVGKDERPPKKMDYDFDCYLGYEERRMIPSADVHRLVDVDAKDDLECVNCLR